MADPAPLSEDNEAAAEARALAAEITASGHTSWRETEAERQDRFAWEAEGIAMADADVAAGRLVDAAAVRAWVESIGTDHELPVPYSGR